MGQLLEIFSIWDLPWPRQVQGTPSLLQEGQYRQLFELAEFPHNLVNFVNDEVKREAQERAERNEPRRDQPKEQRAQSRRPKKILPYINPVFQRSSRVENEIHVALSQSQEDPKTTSISTSSSESGPDDVTPSSLSSDDVLWSLRESWWTDGQRYV